MPDTHEGAAQESTKPADVLLVLPAGSWPEPLLIALRRIEAKLDTLLDILSPGSRKP